MTGKASMEYLEGLHAEFTQVCYDKLAEQEPINAMTVEGPVTVGYRRAIKSGDMGAIRAFLNDNKVTVDIAHNAGMQAVEKELARSKKYSERVEKSNVTALPLPSPKVAANG